MPTVQPPYFGAAYYPEDWHLEQIDRDIALMLEARMNCMRIGEFAWSSMEPTENEYRFDWLHTVVEKLGAAGIAVIMGTPTATPPAWLTERYPEVLAVSDSGKPMQHGARRHVCPTSPVYRDLCERIVDRMAREFGRDDRIVGWQIDNEVYPIGFRPTRPCCCPSCYQRFLQALEGKFGSIEALNQAWCLSLWSQEYQSFSQIPLPRADTWHHPSLLAAYSHFASDSYAEYCTHQARVLRRHVTQPIGTDMMPFSGVDYTDMHREMDMVQFNHYNDIDSLWRAGFWFDFIRPLKPAPFWNTETQANWNGSVCINGGVKPEGWCRANSWLPIVLGGEANLYWLWRQHWAGQELMHGAVVSSAGRPLPAFNEVQAIGEGLSRSGDLLRTTRPTPSGLGLFYCQYTARMLQHQPIMPGLDYEAALQERWWRPLTAGGRRPDVIGCDVDLSPYRVLAAPLLLTLEHEGLADRLHAWVRAGGTLIIGPLADIRNLEAAKYRDAPFGRLEEWTGARAVHCVPGSPGPQPVVGADGTPLAASTWFDGFDPGPCIVHAGYPSGPNAGLAAIVQAHVGAGTILWLGCMPEAAELPRVLALAVPDGTVGRTDCSAGVVAAPRSGPGGRGMAAVEVDGAPGYLTLPEPMTDLLTGRSLSGKVELEPYGVLVAQADQP